jgi:hypothetical protein
VRLCKFLPARFAIDDILLRRIKIAQFDEMNDPFELSGVQVTDQIVLDSFIPHILKNYGVISFSRTWADPVLWAHYAEQHRGICLAFKPAGIELKKTAYVSTKKTYNTGSLLKRMLRMRGTPNERAKLQRMSSGIALKMMRDILSVKFKSWAYEREVRAFTSLKERKGEFYFLNFGRHLKLVEVILGCRCDAASGLRAALERYGHRVQISVARPLTKQFKMAKRPYQLET